MEQLHRAEFWGCSHCVRGRNRDEVWGELGKPGTVQLPCLLPGERIQLLVAAGAPEELLSCRDMQGAQSTSGIPGMPSWPGLSARGEFKAWHQSHRPGTRQESTPKPLLLPLPEMLLGPHSNWDALQSPCTRRFGSCSLVSPGWGTAAEPGHCSMGEGGIPPFPGGMLCQESTACCCLRW